MAEDPDHGWHYLDAERRSQGPFPVSYLKGINSTEVYPRRR